MYNNCLLYKKKSKSVLVLSLFFNLFLPPCGFILLSKEMLQNKNVGFFIVLFLTGSILLFLAVSFINVPCVCVCFTSFILFFC